MKSIRVLTFKGGTDKKMNDAIKEYEDEGYEVISIQHEKITEDSTYNWLMFYEVIFEKKEKE